MKKIFFSLLWIGCLLFQFSNAQGNELKEFIDDSEQTLQAEYNSWESDSEKNEWEILISDVDDYWYDDDYRADDDYYRDHRDFHVEKDWDYGIDESDITRIMWFFFGFLGIFFLCRLVGFIFWIWMLVDAAKYQKKDRVGWILVLVFFNVLWALIYLFAAKIGRKKEDTIAD